MASRAGVFVLILLLPTVCALESPRYFVVWNVGQGLWSTAVDGQTCLHLDMGGERAPWNAVMLRCRGLRNEVHLSHWDWDHINFVGRARNLLPNLCRLNWPQLTPSKNKSARVAGIPACTGTTGLHTWSPVSPRSTNEASAVALWREVLMPGDSNKGAEKFWSSQLDVSGIRVLVLGHHGSRTSTSRELLTRMPRLKMAIASARRRRYGHPHAEVIALLKDFRVPVLNTEDWGNIYVWQ